MRNHNSSFSHPYLSGLLCIFVSIFVVGSGCKGPTEKPGTTQTEQTPTESASLPAPAPTDIFRWCSFHPKTLDPAKANDMAGHWVLYNLFEGLTAPAAGTAPATLGVAAAPPVIEAEGLRWTFSLRKDARWSDGEPVTAHHFVDGWRRAVDPATGSTVGDTFRIVKNATEILAGKAPPSELGIRALDDYTLEINLAQKSPVFMSTLAGPPMAPTRLDLIKKHGPDWTRPGNLVGNGAFVLKEWTIRDQITFHKNTHYWDANTVKLEKAQLFHAESTGHCRNLYQAGKIHVLNPISGDQISLLQSEGNRQLHVYPKLAASGIVFNTKRPPLDQPLVRKAIAQAIDREALVKHVLARGDQESLSLFPAPLEKLMNYRSPQGPEFDPEEASRLLAQAGYPKGAGLPPITYLYNTHDLTRRIAEYFQRSLKENLGVEIQLENVEWGTFLERMGKRDFEMGPWNFSGLEDPFEWADMFRSTGTLNWANFQNEEYDALLDRIGEANGMDERNKLTAQAEKQLLDAMIVAPLFSKVGAFLSRESVHGYLPQTQDIHMLKYISITP